jgi:wyosine [tRNA(Phe)-imidazoG37] synthetase (radical SAM superfamily)
VISEVKKITRKKIAVLTNSSLLGDPAVRRELALADLVICKLDASNGTEFRAINRPHAAIHYDELVEGIRKLAAEMPGRVAVQTMIGHMSPLEVARFAAILATIGPAEVQLNTPFRPVPRAWARESRAGFADSVPVRKLKVIDQKSADEIETALRRLTGLKVTSVYQLNKGVSP